MAVAVERMKSIAVYAAGMHSHQHILPVRNISMHQGQVRFSIQAADVAKRLEFTPGCRDVAGGVALHQFFGLSAVADEIGDRNHLESEVIAKFHQLWNARHAAVFIHDFANNSTRRKAGEIRQIDRRFRLAGAHEHAARTRSEREHMTGARQILRP